MYLNFSQGRILLALIFINLVSMIPPFLFQVFRIENNFQDLHIAQIVEHFYDQKLIFYGSEVRQQIICNANKFLTHVPRLRGSCKSKTAPLDPWLCVHKPHNVTKNYCIIPDVHPTKETFKHKSLSVLFNTRDRHLNLFGNQYI